MVEQLTSNYWLTNWIKKVEEHQARQQRIIRVQDDIQRHHEALLRVVQKLDSARSDLDQSLNEAKKEVQAIDYANKSNVQFTDVISYASKLSKYTSAPPNFASMNRDIKVDFEKPYPDEERMRRGLLYWQNHPQPYLEDKMESSDNESSAEEDATKEGHGTAGKPAEEAAGDPFWILDLNPDLAS
ncbi:mediator complex, subunit Med4 [Radiomyces spectabilis]|uniref:mediator complex, subunit Med4 n=1 Tax=Radiomyces spectabilis TaxID=64574 RepID=UPI00221EB8DC|nr:mediator complex, subunit Med4 [Radiomyces spectabilis]KAI8367618.1 mediator complex, subunit Med4 [Radiomyces spectabilis]